MTSLEIKEGIHEHPEMIYGDIYIRQPSSSSHAERQHAAEESCANNAKNLVNDWNKIPLPLTFTFVAVTFVRIDNSRSETKTTILTNERHHEFKVFSHSFFLDELTLLRFRQGTGVCKFVYKVEKSA